MQNRQEAEGVRQEATERKARKRQEASGNRQQLSDRRAAEDEGGESIKKRGGGCQIMHARFQKYTKIEKILL